MTAHSPPLLRRRPFWLVVLILGVVGFGLLRSNATALVGGYPSIEGYRSVDDRTIVVTVAVAPRSWTRVTAVAETPEAIRVTIESLDWPIPLPQTDQLERRDLAISLGDDLGTRVIEDADGHPIPAPSSSSSTNRLEPPSALM